MAKNRRHLKRHSMPTSWPTQRKSITFITKPNPGSMKRDYVVALVVLLRDVLGLVHTTKEAKYVVNNDLVSINGVVTKEIKAPVGLFDVVEIAKIGKKFTFVFDTFGKIKIIDLKDNTISVKVKNKVLVKGGKVQITGFNGFNVLVDSKEAQKIPTNSTVLVDLKTKKITKTLPLEEKSSVYVMDGKYVGISGQITSITKYNGVAPDLVTIKTKTGEQTTSLNYCFVVSDLKALEGAN